MNRNARRMIITVMIVTRVKAVVMELLITMTMATMTVIELPTIMTVMKLLMELLTTKTMNDSEGR